MSYRVFLFLFTTIVAGCQSPYNHSPAETGSEERTEQVILEQERFSFDAFLRKLTARPQLPPRDSLQELARRYFPDSTIHLDHYLHARPIPFKEGYSLIYYEYSLDEPHTDNIYLGVFNKEGEALDVLNIKEVSYDGSITVNVIDQKVLEIEYYDFFDSKQLLKDEIYTDQPGRGNSPPFWMKTAYNPELEEQIIDYYYYENYSIRSDGTLALLRHPEEVIKERRYPFVSLRVLSFAELEKYSSAEIREMINEVYASYGYIFRNEELLEKYQQLNWYRARHISVDSSLSDVERVNIKKLSETDLELTAGK